MCLKCLLVGHTAADQTSQSNNVSEYIYIFSFKVHFFKAREKQKLDFLRQSPSPSLGFREPSEPLSLRLAKLSLFKVGEREAQTPHETQNGELLWLHLWCKGRGKCENALHKGTSSRWKSSPGPTPTPPCAGVPKVKAGDAAPGTRAAHPLGPPALGAEVLPPLIHPRPPPYPPFASIFG